MKFFKNLNKRKKVILLCSAGAFVLSLIIGISIFLFSNKESKVLSEFKIKTFKQDVSKTNELNVLEFEESENASLYKVYVYNDKNKLLKEIETKKTSVNLDDLEVEYDDELTIKVIAFDKLNNKLRSSNELNVTWGLPSLQINEINDIGNDEDLVVRININEEEMSKYNLILTKDDEEKLKLEIDNTKMVIPSSYYKNNLGKYKVSLVVDSIILSSFEFNVGLPLIGEISIDSIKHNSTIPWDDFDITYSGGENADLYEISIFKNNEMIFFKQLKELTYKMDITKLEENSTYVLKVMAYNKIDNTINNQKVLSFKTTSKQKLEPVTSSVASGDIYIGKSITLTNKKDTATIYYTIDGGIPSASSLKYTEPIVITTDTVIKAIAIYKNSYDSDVSTFDYKAKEKPISVYISPSLQTSNLGVQSTGFTNESEMMNKIADVIVSGLKSKGIVVYRSKNTMDLDEVVTESKSKNVDLHLAIHSNAFDGNTTGIETYVYSKSSKIAPLASQIQSGMESIYEKDNTRKLYYCAETGNVLKEVNPENVDNGILLEVAYHDNATDAKWIVDNISVIGNKLVSVIASYFGK